MRLKRRESCSTVTHCSPGLIFALSPMTFSGQAGQRDSRGCGRVRAHNTLRPAAPRRSASSPAGAASNGGDATAVAKVAQRSILFSPAGEANRSMRWPSSPSAQANTNDPRPGGPRRAPHPTEPSPRPDAPAPKAYTATCRSALRGCGQTRAATSGSGSRGTAGCLRMSSRRTFSEPTSGRRCNGDQTACRAPAAQCCQRWWTAERSTRSSAFRIRDGTHLDISTQVVRSRRTRDSSGSARPRSDARKSS